MAGEGASAPFLAEDAVDGGAAGAGEAGEITTNNITIDWMLAGRTG